MEAERVIFKKDYDHYRKEWVVLAFWPDAENLPGRISYNEVLNLGTNAASLSCEGSADYYHYSYKCKPVKDEKTIAEAKALVESVFGIKVKVCRRNSHRRKF